MQGRDRGRRGPLGGSECRQWSRWSVTAGSQGYLETHSSAVREANSGHTQLAITRDGSQRSHSWLTAHSSQPEMFQRHVSRMSRWPTFLQQSDLPAKQPTRHLAMYRRVFTCYMLIAQCRCQASLHNAATSHSAIPGFLTDAGAVHSTTVTMTACAPLRLRYEP